MNPQSPTDTLSSTSATTSPRHALRPPPPSLFIGPPSHNASNISLPSLHPSTTHSSATKPTKANPPPSALGGRSNRDADSGPAASSPLGRSSQRNLEHRQHQNERDRTDALWAEMQATLAEVELSAARGTQFFGPEHSAALEELRGSQIALAQAWARSEADEIVDHPAETGNGEVKEGKSAGEDKRDSKGPGREEETEGDILLARKRREANDKYFWRVHQGVLDVVGKLEEVAGAMGKVEKESREIWSESESMDTTSVTS